MNHSEDLAGIDLVWWPTLLKSEGIGQLHVDPQDRQRFTACLANLALALADEEE